MRLHRVLHRQPLLTVLCQQYELMCLAKVGVTQRPVCSKVLSLQYKCKNCILKMTKLQWHHSLLHACEPVTLDPAARCTTLCSASFSDIYVTLTTGSLYYMFEKQNLSQKGRTHRSYHIGIATSAMSAMLH